MIGHKECPPDGVYEQYKLSVEVIPLDDNVELDDASDGLGSAAYHPSKSLEKSKFTSWISLHVYGIIRCFFGGYTGMEVIDKRTIPIYWSN